MDLINFNIYEDSISLTDWLKSFFISNSIIYQLKQNNLIMVNKNIANWNQLLVKGDQITIDLSPFENNNYKSYYQNLNVIYEDEDVLVVNKTNNILIHPDGTQEDTLGNIVSFYYEKNGINRTVRHIHRLDFETSGCVIYAKHFLAHSFLNNQLENKLISRYYQAITTGTFKNLEGLIDLKIGRNRHESGKFIVSKSGKDAQTEYKVIKRGKVLNLVELKLLTGRTHQIRVHLSNDGNYIVGDKLYGKESNQFLMLHAHSVEFTHPRTKRIIKVNFPAPKSFTELRKKI